MPATQHDDDDRWQMALDGLTQATQQYQTLVRIVQNGFSTIGTRLDDYGQRIGKVEKAVQAVYDTEANCQQRLAKIEADGKGRSQMMILLMALVVVLLVASFAQAGLWWYVVTRLFHI